MPRTARLEELGLPYHVIVQGIERRRIFLDDGDRTGFVLRATRIFAESQVQVLAWALVRNHAHLVLLPTDGSLGKAMQRLLGSYAIGFNRRHERVGRLFRDRFWSRPVEDDDDLAGLIGYVLLNPVRAGIVADVDALRAYPWTSLRELAHPGGPRRPLVDRTEALSLFGRDTRSALDAVSAMISGQIENDPRGDHFGATAPGGGSALSTRERLDLGVAATHALELRATRVERVLRERESRTARRKRLEAQGWDLDAVVRRAAQLCEVSASCIRQGRRTRAHSRARGLVAYFAGLYLCCNDSDIARATGIARQSVPQSRRRGARAAAGDGTAWTVFFGVEDHAGIDDEDASPKPRSAST